MKWICLVFAAVLCGGAQGLTEVEKVLESTGGVLNNPAPAKFSLRSGAPGLRETDTRDACTPDGGVTCVQDSLKYCDVDDKFTTKPCKELQLSTPFCDCKKNRCVAVRPAECEIEPTSCPEEGLWPDPKNCRAFAYCDSKNKLYPIKCASAEQIYSPSQEKCVKNAPCFLPRCPAGPLPVSIPWKGSPRYYLQCNNGQGRVRRCQEEKYGMENGSGCVFLCTESGYFPEPVAEKCKEGRYNRCYKYGSTFKREEMICGKVDDVQQTFNETLNICLSSDNCGTESPEV